ncbi:thiol-disulfide oxidoreductase DCC family protein [Kiloniella sp. EL199]|uniref:thiol-disulfide oxidoreductase DCC family protein n=1 Tax=Kiloniella sp. EL199 TaxID=2107581 RepID=UPI000EA08B3F|nr:DCC1-like thiol-disulfide oxidoreductase family protein [Kiloniella sp. EL199]
MSTNALPFKDYSYRDAIKFSNFDDSRPIIVFDGECALCSAFIQFVIRHDKFEEFQFTTGQSSLGQALFTHYNLDTVNFETNLLISKGKAYAKMSAFSQTTSLLPYPAKFLSLARLLPSPIDNWLYDLVAQNRYRLFGRADSCLLPDSNLRKRLIE